MNILDRIKLIDFPDNRYYQDIYHKRQIVLHHTVSGVRVKGDVDTWKGDSRKIATCIIIARDGTPYQLFDSKFYAHHLGVKTEIFKRFDLLNRNLLLDRESIGIEMDNWGGLKCVDGLWYPDDYIKKTKPIKEEDIYFIEYRGYNAFERYTDSQINSLKLLLLFFGNKYKIDLSYNADMWDISKNALLGKPGIWSHTSFRDDKSDCFPQYKLVNMLNNLK